MNAVVLDIYWTMEKHEINKTISRSLELGAWPLKNKTSAKFITFLHYKIAKKRLFKYSIFAGNILLLGVVIWFVVLSPQTVPQSPALIDAQNGSSTVNPLDQLASASIALTVARMDNLPEATPIMNQADSETALLSVAPTNDSIVSKPQVVATDYVSNKDIKTYVVKSGDTITSIAQKFNISVNSILWSNNLSGNDITPGVKLLIPPISGIIYTVKAGDTPASLAKKYQSDENLIIAYNDAEIKGIYTGERIIIPNGTIPSVVSYNNSVTASYGWGYQASYGYNGYDFGYCTWWVAKLRADAGDPLPDNLGNASTWAIRAQQFGLPVGTTPAVGAAVVTSTTADYGEGHVAYVTAVHSNGTITISEMNRIAWDVADTRVIPSAGFEYIY